MSSNFALPPADSSGCELIAKAYYIDIFLCNLIRQQFSHPQYSEFAGLADLVYRPDNRHGGDQQGTIKIELADSWNPAAAGALPAIVIRDGDMASVRLGIADRHMFPIEDVENLGRKTMSRAWAGSVMIYSLARQRRQSKLIGAAVAEHLQSFSEQIRKALKLARVQVATLGATRSLKEATAAFATPVTVEYGFINTWYTTPVSAVTLNRVGMEQTQR